MRADQYKLRELLGPVVVGMGYELVGIEFHPNSVNALLRIYIDHGNGITLDDCQRVSGQVSGVLDVADPIPSRYTLEVSSPGLDRPLFTVEHFQRFEGREAKIQLNVPLNGRRKYRGVLGGLREGAVTLICEEGEVTIPLDRIDRARLVPE